MHYYRVVHGFQTQVFRYANVYGPWQDGTGEAGVVAIFSEAMLGQRPLKINGDGEQTRDYVYVGDLVEAAARAARADRSGVWNLGTGVETSVNRLFALLAAEYGYRGRGAPRRRSGRRAEAQRSRLARSCGRTSACRPGPLFRTG